MDWTRDDFFLMDARERVDVHCIFELLGKTYSLSCIPDHRSDSGRVVTDYPVFSWVADVVIDDLFRRQGLGKWMMTCIKGHPLLRSTQMVLQTRDAHTLYEKFGFSQSPKLMSTAVVGL